jgi:uncharacterized protein (TIGR02145 family)
MNGASSSYTNPSGIKGVCPDGWHVPSLAEWTELTDLLGGESIAGGKLKEAGNDHWEGTNAGAINSYGFTALPGGYRVSTGQFWNTNREGMWWSATELDSFNGLRMYMNTYYEYAVSNDDPKDYGFSLRCMKD